MCSPLLQALGRYGEEKSPPLFQCEGKKLYFSVAILSNRSALLSGLESVILLLFGVLALRGLCSDNFQEDCGATGLEVLYQFLCFNTYK